MLSSREVILGRIRAAVGSSVPPSRVHTRPSPGSRDLVELLADRLRDYGCRVHIVSEAGSVIASIVHGRKIGVAEGIPAEWVEGWKPALSELDTLDGMLTGSALAIAETGTIVLDGGPGQGRRALTLVPDYHLCVVDRIVGTVAEAVDAVTPTRPLTWVSGPSATSDIELSRVEGVHGPRTLEVIILARCRVLRVGPPPRP